MILTHIGGPTVLIEIDGWRLLTDPTFDAAGGHYRFGWGTSSNKLSSPAMSSQQLPRIDAVLLTHDHHADNLDTAGRALLEKVPTILTTTVAARRLTGTDVRGLEIGKSTLLTAPGRPALRVRATPARHGPPLSRPIVGAVVGFAIGGRDDDHVRVWVTGDTVLHRALLATARSLSIDVLIVHVGGVQFPITGPVRYTMTGRQAVRLIEATSPGVAVPVHVEGWSHFRDTREHLTQAVAASPAAASVQWLSAGVPTEVG